MSLGDARLSEALAAWDEPAAGDEHPSPEGLWALAAGELEPQRSRPLFEHVASCPACAEDLRLSREMVAASGAPDAGWQTQPAAARRDRRWLPSLAAAALLVIAVGVGWRLQQPAEPTLRTGGEETVRSLLEAGAILPRAAARLRWTGPEGARYDVVVTTEELDVVALAHDLEQPELVIPAADLTGLDAGSVLLWQVDANLPGGGLISSRTFDLRLGEGER